MKDVPRARFVGMNLGAAGYVLQDLWNRISFLADNPCHHAAHALAGDNNNLATVGAIGLAVRLARALSELGPIDLDFTG